MQHLIPRAARPAQRLHHQRQHASPVGTQHIRQQFVAQHGRLPRGDAAAHHGPAKALYGRLARMALVGDPQIAAESLHSHGAAVVGQDHDLHTRRPHIGEPAAQVRVRLRLGLGCQGIVQIAQQQPDAVPHKKRGRDAAVAVKHPVGRHGNGHRYPTPLIKYSSIVPRTSWSRKGVRLCS